MEILLKQESYDVIGACFEVYKEKGSGFVEPIYHECLEKEFRLRGTPAVSKPKLEIEYKGEILERKPEPDFVCYRAIILEIKAVKKLTDEHRAQLRNYLRATGLEVGLLVNFCGLKELEWERIVASNPTKSSSPSSEEINLQ